MDAEQASRRLDTAPDRDTAKADLREAKRSAQALIVPRGQGRQAGEETKWAGAHRGGPMPLVAPAAYAVSAGQEARALQDMPPTHPESQTSQPSAAAEVPDLEDEEWSI